MKTYQQKMFYISVKGAYKEQYVADSLYKAVYFYVFDG